MSLCDTKCNPCHDHRRDVFICLKSEREFLDSLLRLGSTDGGRRNLLGFSPTVLIDWYLYAKRSFFSSPPKDPIGWGLELLDELGKVLFDLAQVTARRQVSGSAGQNSHPPQYYLLTDIESEVLYALDRESELRADKTSESVTSYQARVKQFWKDCADLETQLETPSAIVDIREHFASRYQCRHSILSLSGHSSFQSRWGGGDTRVLLLDRCVNKPASDDGNECASLCQSRNEKEVFRSRRLVLACAYLHGVSRFAFTNMDDAAANGDVGYWIENHDGEETEFSLAPYRAVEDPRNVASQAYCNCPEPGDSAVKISCELAADLTREYWASEANFARSVHPNQGLKPDGDEICDVLFMCKDKHGWFWVLTDDQMAVVRDAWCRVTGLSPGQLGPVVEKFRFSHGGMIKHLEDTKAIVSCIDNFEQEPICAIVGYSLEVSQESQKLFSIYESSFPGVESGSYLYYRLSAHVKAKDIDKKKVLPEGALVAVFRLDRKMLAQSGRRANRIAAIRLLVERWRAKVDALNRIPDVVREIMRPAQERSARAAIMSRNLSHNIGSHALANPELYTAVGIDGIEAQLLADGKCGQCLDHAKKNAISLAKTRLATFHQYTQTRLDFIARTLNPQTERPEPLFLLSDLLNGLFRQTVLLDTLLADRGFPMNPTLVGAKGEGRSGFTREISFHIEIALSDESMNYRFARSRGPDAAAEGFVLASDGGGDSKGATDLLVGIPGGMIGCHALYSFIENLMRNAAKYGKHCDDQNRCLEIYLRLRHARECDCDNSVAYYVLEAWENLNDESSSLDAANSIRKHVGEDLINEKGEPQPTGQGIQEMKIAAEFLSGRTTFHADPPSCPNAGDCDYCKFVDHSGDSLTRVDTPEPLRCFLGERECGDKQGTQTSLIYQLLVPKPRLLGLVKPEMGDSVQVVDQAEFVVNYPSIDSLAQGGAAFGVILDVDNDQWIDEAVKRIQKLHHALPYRLMVLSRSDERLQKWKDHPVLKRMCKGYDSDAFDPTSDLPVRRLHFIANPGVCETCLQASDGIPADSFLGATGWHAVVLKLYHLWLTAFKGIPEGGAWNVVIGFEREAGQISGRWATGLKLLEAQDQHDLSGMSIKVHVQETRGIQTRSSPNAQMAQLKDPAKRSSFIVFDNHSEAVMAMGVGEFHGSPLHESPAVYQDFTGSRELSLCQALESPPQEPFSFAFWLYGLVEGSLFNVAILDERVAESCMDNVVGMQKLKVWPIFRVSNAGEEKWISPGVENSEDRDFAGHLVMSGAQGVSIEWKWNSPKIGKDVDEKAVSQMPRDAKPQAAGQNLMLDAVVLHEGVIDTLPSSIWPSKDEEVQEAPEAKLLGLAPRVLRSSGRGSLARRLSSALPFIEFSEISETVYRSRNKPALGKAICSVSGFCPAENGRGEA